MLQLQTQRLHVVMSENEAFALVQAQSVDDAGVRLGIVDDHVAGSSRQSMIEIMPW